LGLHSHIRQDFVLPDFQVSISDCANLVLSSGGLLTAKAAKALKRILFYHDIGWGMPLASSVA
jgi:hypothetical protein